MSQPTDRHVYDNIAEHYIAAIGLNVATKVATISLFYHYQHAAVSLKVAVVVSNSNPLLYCT